MSKLSDAAKKIPSWIANTAAFSQLPDNYKQIAYNAIQEEIDIENEKLYAQAMGMTVEEMRLANLIPSLIDWSKLGTKISAKEASEAIDKITHNTG
jgi:hypothetical protein